jgi:outer membrane protein OmpA-like peptidoglycan-associated protein
VAAKAEAVTGPYVSLGAGANFEMDPRVRSAIVGAGATSSSEGVNLGKTRIRTDTGFLGLGAIGYGLGNGLRVELEGDYRQNKYSGIGQATGGGIAPGFATFPGTHIHGTEQKYGAMVNVLYDFDPNVLGLGFFPFPITPYIGAGVGWQQMKYDDVNISGPGFFLHSTGSADALAYQAIIGAAFPVPAVPGLSLTAEYRFMGLAGNQAPRGQLFVDGVSTRARVRTSDNYNHSVLLGVRYAFGEAPPPPPPPPAPAPVAAPAPAPARTYLVFFDWDRADLTARARQIIAEAAQASTHVQYTRILVNGYTDTSGTPAYNLRLSLRRADNVAAELVRDGVPRQAIEIHGYGETHLLVPTGPGVREPQNRRVEIVLQ